MRILALDVGGTSIKSAIIDDRNQLSEQMSTPSHTVAPDKLVEKIIGIAAQYAHFDVVGVSMTGQIDDKTQTVLVQDEQEKRIGLVYPAGKILNEKLNKPVFLLNDSNAAALAEAYLGAGRDYDNFLCLTYGTGVGGGIILNRKLFSGRCGIAGEVGHMVIHSGGRPCSCGHRGCYEIYAATTALIREAKKIVPELKNAREFFELLQNNPALQTTLEEWIAEIVEGLYTLTYIFNPACIVLGGGIMEREDVLAMVCRRFYEHVIPAFGSVDILPAYLGNRAGMLGAAVYARQCLEEDRP